MGRFKKGLFMGGLLGAGLMWMNTTKKGKEMREQLFEHAAQVYGRVKKEVEARGAVDTMTKNKYVKVVQEVVDEYAVQSGLADGVKNMVNKIVAAQWGNVQKELKSKKKKKK